MPDSFVLWFIAGLLILLLVAVTYFSIRLILSYAIMKAGLDKFLESLDLIIDREDYIVEDKKEVPESPYYNPVTKLYDFYYGRKQQEGEGNK